MDPNATLRILRDLCSYIVEVVYDENGEWIGDSEVAGYAVDLADEFTILDNWIMNGGFLPADWVK